MQRNFCGRTRREFLWQTGGGFGAAALAGMLGADGFFPAAQAGTAGGLARVAPKAKSVIFLFMYGGPSHVDTFDYKPGLVGRDNQTVKVDTFGRGGKKNEGRIVEPRWKFKQHGECGKWVSELFPHVATCVDKVTFVNTMTTDQFNHAPAQLLVHTGSPRMGSASIGSWVTYGLGSENENLPGYVVLLSGGKAPSVGQAGWGSGYLPSVYQGVQCRSEGDPVLFLSNPDGIDNDLRRRTIEAINRVNEQTHREWGDPETVTRIAQYEMACRMQLEASDAMSLDGETADALAAYGAEPGKESFANNCLLARRLAERDVRFVQLFDWGWDTHGTSVEGSIDQGLTKKARQIDRPIHALLTDLEQRGLLDDTLVVWAGEFGRTPYAQSGNGRDHNNKGYTIWMAGGGVKGGTTYGETDDFSYNIVRDPVHVHDLQATMLHLLGIDHERLTYRHQGRRYRLTDVHGHVVDALLA